MRNWMKYIHIQGNMMHTILEPTILLLDYTRVHARARHYNAVLKVN